jgi:hypothetical protein
MAKIKARKEKEADLFAVFATAGIVSLQMRGNRRKSRFEVGIQVGIRKGLRNLRP